MNRTELCCGIDPGRDKFGLALAASDILYASLILKISDLEFAADCIANADWNVLFKHPIEGKGVPEDAFFTGVYIGNGTNHRMFVNKLEERAVNYFVVDEKMTTLGARELYWSLHPPRGLSRMIPASLRVPPRPLDDLAAWAIVKKGLEAKRTGIQAV